MTTTATTDTETLIGITTREILVGYTEPTTKLRSSFRRIPAGTEVYCGRVRRTNVEVRVPGTLFTATVHPSAVTAA